MIGKTISHYKILKKLGEGGMGVVYKAQDTKLDRFVALKFLTAQSAKDPVLKKRFIQEAKSVSSLDDPNICTVYEIAETPDEQTYIVMAFCEGATLKQTLEKGPLDLDRALNILTQVAHALEKAHAKGIVHRDIKPPSYHHRK
jgi:serine/threonine protein kinase